MTRPIDQIETAVLEIDATITTLDEAVDQLLTLAETLRDTVAGQDDTAKSLISELTLACSFQDLCGQRLEKAKKLLCSAASLNMDTILAKRPVADEISEDDEQSLLNGPALPGTGVDQSDVDEMLTEDVK